MFYKVKKVVPLKNIEDYFLMIYFENGEVKKYDLKQLFNSCEAFNSLAQVKGLFEQVSVDHGGYGIFWNDDLDISCNELYFNAEPV